MLRKVYFPTHAQCDHFQQFYNRRNVKVHVPIIKWLHCDMFCLLSIRSYEARMIMYARALYRSFKVKWIGKVYFPTHVLFIINTVIRGAHDNVRTCVIS